MAKRITSPTMTDALRNELARAESIQGVSKATGVSNASLLRFARGDQSLRLDMADLLAEHFGITVHPPRRSGRAAGGRAGA